MFFPEAKVRNRKTALSAFCGFVRDFAGFRCILRFYLSQDVFGRIPARLVVARVVCLRLTKTAAPGDQIPMKKALLSLVGAALVASAFAFSISNSRTAETEQRQGVHIFYKGQKPTDAYEFLGSVEATGMVKSYKPDYMVPLMLKKAKEKYPNAEAVIFTEENNWKLDAVSFKK